MSLLGPSTEDPSWADRLESAASDATTGKMLCVCAASAIAREVISSSPDAQPGASALELLRRWIDDPTDEGFEGICALVFGEEGPEFEPYGAVWWALRCAASSVGNEEAAWALGGACVAAREAGFSAEHSRMVAGRELKSRARPAIEYHS